MLDKIKIRLQYMLPKQCLTEFAGWFASRNAGFMTQWAIKLFAKVYKVNMNEAQKVSLLLMPLLMISLSVC